MTHLGELLAAIITEEEKGKITGDIPIFIAQNQDEKVQIAVYLSKTLDGAVHDLGNGVYYIVRH